MARHRNCERAFYGNTESFITRHPVVLRTRIRKWLMSACMKKDARDKGIDVLTLAVPLSTVDRALLDGEAEGLQESI